MDTIRVLVSGAAGKMGQELVRAIHWEEDLKLVGACDVSQVGVEVGQMCGIDLSGVVMERFLSRTLDESLPQVVCDFTHADALRGNLPVYLEHQVSMVIGTTGLRTEELKDLEKKCLANNIGCLVAPNFAIGAVLMMQFAKTAAKYLERAEIIEFHHPQKKDAPSGTAIKTAEGIMEMNREMNRGVGEDKTVELVPGARGGRIGSVNIHSVRLSGFVAHQEVIFGGEGQTLTIRHDSLSRVSFMPGIIMAIRYLASHKGFYYGLEKILDL